MHLFTHFDEYRGTGFYCADTGSHTQGTKKTKVRLHPSRSSRSPVPFGRNFCRRYPLLLSFTLCLAEELSSHGQTS